MKREIKYYLVLKDFTGFKQGDFLIYKESSPAYAWDIKGLIGSGYIKRISQKAIIQSINCHYRLNLE